MNIFIAFWAVLVSFLPFFIPGIFFVRVNSLSEIFPKGARILLWSLGINILTLLLGLLLGISVLYSFAGVAILSAVFAFIASSRRVFSSPYQGEVRWGQSASPLSPDPLQLPLRKGERTPRLLLAFFLAILFLSSCFIIPLLFIQDGLPTGDVQKSIIWAQESITTNHLPDYSKSFALLNRDPVDFYTPGLHSVSAFVMHASALPLLTISIFSIVSAIAVAWIAGALTHELFPKRKYAFLPLLTILLVLTQFRFLRYLREPGYHFQNSFGEFFVFGMILLALSFIVKRRMIDVALFFLCAIALFFTHQFSAFIGAFAFLFGGITLALLHTKDIRRSVTAHWHISLAGVIGLIIAVYISVAFGLIKKIPSIFTLHPHLANLLPNITDYPSTMGIVWFLVGSSGLVLLLIESYKNRKNSVVAIIFCVMTLALFALSQGPNIGIDIPPIRALFYIAVPFSILGAYFLYCIASRNKKLFVITSIIVAITVTASAQKAFGSISHSVRTNSTLTIDQQYAISELAKDKNNLGIVIDDYNKRSASWFVLSGHPMFTRISSDLQTQMNEAGQSKVRNNLYRNQLDYEKIFALGSMPEIGTLIAKQGIGYVTGIAGSSQFAFAHNPILQSGIVADNATIYTVKNTGPACNKGSLCDYLLQPTTLANDIGDDEDTFEHLEVSMRTPLLSDPKVSGNTTYRETNSPYIPFEFNVADYVQKIWPSNSSLKLAIRLTKPSSELSIITTSGRKISLQNTTLNTIILQPDEAMIDERGFITLTIYNPMQNMVGIDVIALGL